MQRNGKVLILCPLWDSEQYIGQEVASVVNQTYTNWELLFANDNANQSTIDIINEFMAKDSRIRMMGNDTGRHGSHGNYRNLIINADTKNDAYDYYAYIDNDDIWKPDKLEVYVKKAEEVRKVKGENTPVCFTCNMEIIDSDGNLIDPDFASSYAYEIKNPVDAFLTHRVFGCNVFIDRQIFFAMREVMKDPEFSPGISFDNFTYQMGYALDADLSFIPKVLMSYRRHLTNTTKEAV